MDLLSQRIDSEGFEKSYDPEGDGDCFYNAAAFQLERDGSVLKNEIFEYLTRNQYDVSFIIVSSLVRQTFSAQTLRQVCLHASAVRHIKRFTSEELLINAVKTMYSWGFWLFSTFYYIYQLIFSGILQLNNKDLKAKGMVRCLFSSYFMNKKFYEISFNPKNASIDLDL